MLGKRATTSKRPALFWVIALRVVVILTEGSGQHIVPIFMGLESTILGRLDR